MMKAPNAHINRPALCLHSANPKVHAFGRSALNVLLGTIRDSRKFNELASRRDRVNVDVMNSRISSRNPTINAMMSVDHALYAFVFCNDDRAAEILACSRIVSTN